MRNRRPSPWLIAAVFLAALAFPKACQMVTGWPKVVKGESTVGAGR
jgi:hypothetical protein